MEIVKNDSVDIYMKQGIIMQTLENLRFETVGREQGFDEGEGKRNATNFVRVVSMEFQAARDRERVVSR